MKPLWSTGLWLLLAALLLQTGFVSPTLTAVRLSYYSLLLAGLLLSWRFHSSRVFFALLVVFLSERAVGLFSAGHPTSAPGLLALHSIGVLIPLNFAFLSIRKERGFSFPTIAPAALILFVQALIVAILCRPGVSAAPSVHHSAASSLSFSVLLAFAACALILLARFILFRKPVDSAFFWALAACFLALNSGAVGRISVGYFAAAIF